MTIDQAIEILNRTASNGIPRGETAFNDAVKLGIEGLKALKQHRELDICYACKPLPGETEE